MAEIFCWLNQKSWTPEITFRLLTKTYSINGQIWIFGQSTPLMTYSVHGKPSYTGAMWVSEETYWTEELNINSKSVDTYLGIEKICKKICIPWKYPIFLSVFIQCYIERYYWFLFFIRKISCIQVTLVRKIDEKY